jgi:hypothetical protein
VRPRGPGNEDGAYEDCAQLRDPGNEGGTDSYSI